jgi:hypothetical protein
VHQAVNCNKIKHFVPSAVKCIEEINIFSNTGPYKVSYVHSISQYEILLHQKAQSIEVGFVLFKVGKYF